MDPIKLDLQAEATQEHGRPWPMVLFMAFGLSNIMQGINFHNEFHYLNIALGLAMFASGFVYQHYYKPKIVSFDEHGISGRLSRRETIDVRWDEISRVEVKMYEIVVHLHSGARFNINLNNCTYKQHHDLKPMIIKLAKSRYIDVIC